MSGRILPHDWDGNSGWVLSKDGEPWYVVCLQAQCEREDDPLGRDIGEWLWTDWFSVEHWEREKNVQGTRNWDALYMQRPKPAEGSTFKREWIQRYQVPPAEFLRVVFSLDTAYKPEEVNDPSVITVWGETERAFYLLWVWRERVEYPELKRVLANHYMKWRPDATLIEDKASGQSLIQECRSGVKLDEYPKKIYIPVIAIEPEGSKLIRAVSSSSSFEAKQVYLPEIAPWLVDYESELFGFPISTHDDQVDSTSQFIDWAADKSTQLWMASTGKRTIGEPSKPETSLGVALGRRNNDFRGFNMPKNNKTAKPKMVELSKADHGILMAKALIEGMIANPDNILQQKGGGRLEVYKDLLRDDQVKSCFQQRRSAVVNTDWYVEAASESQKTKQPPSLFAMSLSAYRLMPKQTKCCMQLIMAGQWLKLSRKLSTAS